MKKSLLMLLSLAIVGSSIASACPCNKPGHHKGDSKAEKSDDSTRKAKPGCSCGK